MTTSGTYNYNPPLGEVTLFAFNRCGIRPTALTQEHFQDARTAANMICSDWSNRGVNLWGVQSFTVPFVQGQAAYSASATLVNILDLYVTVSTSGPIINRYILPISRTEFASYSAPTQQGFPTTYWHERTLTPTINFWPTPDGNETSFTYWALVQLQDAGFTGGQTPDMPYAWLAAFAYAMAAHLAIAWAPEKLMAIAPMAQQTYDAAAATGVETAAFYLSPVLSGYWRN